jgi:hypothetical protein
MKRFPLFFIFMSVALHGFSQTYSYRVSWSPVPEARSYRVVVEKLNGEAWKGVHDFEIQALSASLSLESGSYRYRVTGRDILGLWGRPSPWVEFAVEEPEAPVEGEERERESGISETQFPRNRESRSGEESEIKRDLDSPAPDSRIIETDVVADSRSSPLPTSHFPLPQEAPLPTPGAFSVAAGAEVNLLDLGESFAVGVSLTGEWRFSRALSVGGYLMASIGMNALFTLESGVFMRWYFLSPVTAPLELFLEPSVGAAAVLRNFSFTDSLGLPDAALALGIRFFMGNFYAELYGRAGYPFIAGGGLRLGYANRRPE